MGDGVTAPGLGGLWAASRSSRFTPGSPGNHCIGDWVCLGGLSGRHEKSRPHQY